MGTPISRATSRAKSGAMPLGAWLGSFMLTNKKLARFKPTFRVPWGASSARTLSREGVMWGSFCEQGWESKNQRRTDGPSMGMPLARTFKYSSRLRKIALPGSGMADCTPE